MEARAASGLHLSVGLCPGSVASFIIRLAGEKYLQIFLCLPLEMSR